ncbi:MAG: hypothetical protein GX137_03425 [Thermoplasmatales archaeon]|nr:hypothetical protein [Thermoplasmatales archaeon]
MDRELRPPHHSLLKISSRRYIVPDTPYMGRGRNPVLVRLGYPISTPL